MERLRSGAGSCRLQMDETASVSESPWSGPPGDGGDGRKCHAPCPVLEGRGKLWPRSPCILCYGANREPCRRAFTFSSHLRPLTLFPKPQPGLTGRTRRGCFVALPSFSAPHTSLSPRASKSNPSRRRSIRPSLPQWPPVAHSPSAPFAPVALDGRPAPADQQTSSTSGGGLRLSDPSLKPKRPRRKSNPHQISSSNAPPLANRHLRVARLILNEQSQPPSPVV